MILVHSDSVFKVDKGTTPNYSQENPLLQLLTLMEKSSFSAGRENYLVHSLQYLMPFRSLELYGPAGRCQQPGPGAARQQDRFSEAERQRLSDHRCPGGTRSGQRRRLDGAVSETIVSRRNGFRPLE